MTNIESTIVTGFDDALAFIEKVAPGVEASIIDKAKAALADARSAITPVGDAAVVAGVALITSKFALNAPFSATEIALLEGIVAKLQALIPAAA